MKIVICHPILPAPLRLTDNYNYCSVSVSVSVLYTEINDLHHICFSSWPPPQFVLQTWLELIPTKFIIWFPPLFQLEPELTGSVGPDSHMLFYLYEYCYSLLAVMVTNVGEILQMEIFQITLKLPPLWLMLFVMKSCPYFVFKTFCF